MSFKLAINVGYFDGDTGERLPVTVPPSIARDSIVRSGGRLFQRNRPPENQQEEIAGMVSREVLGFLGNEFVLVHECGYLMTTIGFGPHEPMHSFLSQMCREFGCEIYSMNEDRIVTKELLDWLASH